MISPALLQLRLACIAAFQTFEVAFVGKGGRAPRTRPGCTAAHLSQLIRVFDIGYA
jgi:hypothetical protein